jgi:hypothetical protein
MRTLLRSAKQNQRAGMGYLPAWVQRDTLVSSRYSSSITTWYSLAMNLYTTLVIISMALGTYLKLWQSKKVRTTSNKAA